MENGNRPDGLGLGLYVSRHVVQAHGGTITVETPPEGGTRFVLTLPACPFPRRATGVGSPRPRRPAGGPVRRG